MTKAYKKKLIEVALPLEAINAASAREKSIRHGHPSTLHLWWARRPLAACRAVLFAQLVDDPSEYVDELLKDSKVRNAAEAELKERTELWEKRQAEPESSAANPPQPTLEDCAADIERKRLFKIIEDLVKWENSTNAKVLESARIEIRRSCNGELPPISDPFSGGGSIPLEAQRLGLPAYGSDLNPVAVMIGKAMIEIPPKFRDMPPIHPGLKERNHYSNAEGLAEDVKYYGELMREKAFERIGHLYPKVDLPKEYGGGKATIIAWIWARTVPSPDPAFADVHVPLVRSFDLSTKKGQEVWIEPVIDGKEYRFEVRSKSKGYSRHDLKGTVGRQGGFCIVSRTAMPLKYIREQGRAGNLGERLMSIVVQGKRGRIFLPPDHDQEIIARTAVPSQKPETLLPLNPRDFKTPNYGISTFGDLFTSRQLVALNTLSELVHDVRKLIEEDAARSGMSSGGGALRDDGTSAKAYSEAISVYLAFGISRLSDISNAFCNWSSSANQAVHLFGRQAIPMVWDFAETCLFSKMAGDYRTSLNSICKVLVAFSPSSIGHESQCDAQSVRYPNSAVISTDPPYYDNIGYADLSDFFFCWMKPALKDVFPDIFSVLATPKSEELVATPYRHGGVVDAEQFFLTGMTAAISNMNKQTNAEFPVTIYYAFKQSEIEEEGISSAGWATFLQAIIDSGFSVVGTWPLRTERSGRLIASGKNALSNSVVLVCRKRESTAEVVTRAEFIRALKRELPPAMIELQAASIAPADMPQSAIGPGMGVFSRYNSILEADDSQMTVKSALKLINHELDEYLGGIIGEFDADTRFAITWFEQNGLNAGEFGTATNIATARGISVESVKHAGIVESSAGKVRILKRAELEPDWEPANDSHLTIWECLQHLVRVHEDVGISDETARLLKMMGDKADAVKDLAYCLYDISANKRRDAKEATAYNALIADWTELTREAATIHDYNTSGENQTTMNF